MAARDDTARLAKTVGYLFIHKVVQTAVVEQEVAAVPALGHANTLLVQPAFLATAEERGDVTVGSDFKGPSLEWVGGGGEEVQSATS